MTIVSEIKLIRTDTTLDLSQKAEKVCLVIGLDSLMLPDAQRALWGSDLTRRARGGSDLTCKMTKTFDTCDSHVVPHRSTEQAQWCLTSEFGWDPVVSPWYDRTIGTPTLNQHSTGGLAQSVECVVRNDEAPGSKPGFSIFT